MNYRKLLTAALFTVCLLHAQAMEPGKSQALASLEQVPEGLSAADWQGIRRAAAAGVTSQQAYLKASNTGAADGFGFSVAVAGDTVVVGAASEDSSTSGVNSSPNEAALNSGAVYIFTRSGGIWSQQAYLKASNPGASDFFGSAVAITGDTVVVGAYAEDSSTTGVNSSPNERGTSAGAAYVFTRSGVTWSQQAYLKASNSGVGDYFGYKVAVSGETVVVGAYGESSSTRGVGSSPDDDAGEAGAAYVFTRSGVTWSEQAFLKASNTENSDYFGRSVAVAGDTIVVGADGEDSSTTGINGSPNEAAVSSGAAYVFTRSGSIWSQQAFLKASNTGANDNFARSVAIAGDTIVVAADGEDSSTSGVNSSPNEAASASGATYVFTRSGSTWSQQGFLKASNTGGGDKFGMSVAVAGDTLVVGAHLEDSSTTGVNSSPDETAIDAGAAYVFTRSGSTWSQQAYLKASNTGVGDFCGYSVAVSGNTVISGANTEDSSTMGIDSVPNDTGTADNSGAAYIFTLPVAEPPPVIPPVVIPPIIPPAVVKYLVKVKLSNIKFGKIIGGGSFDTGSKVTLRAKPKKGHQFSGWYEKKKLITKKKLLVIKKLTKNRSLVAKFK
jgi:FG-GAP repeat/Divergent InlB B-repeat domain